MNADMAREIMKSSKKKQKDLLGSTYSKDVTLIINDINYRIKLAAQAGEDHLFIRRDLLEKIIRLNTHDRDIFTTIPFEMWLDNLLAQFKTMGFFTNRCDFISTSHCGLYLEWRNAL